MPRTLSEKPPNTEALMQRVAPLLDAGDAQRALDLIGSKPTDSFLQNARGVCLMRLGRVREAIDLYRDIVLHGDALNLDLAQPAIFLTNFATALLLDRNVTGCRSALSELRQDDHPSVVRLLEFIGRWKKGLSWWHRFLFITYGEVRRPVVVDFPPGELVFPGARLAAQPAC